MKRQGDLEWYLKRIGAKHGLEVRVVSLDLGYGADLDDPKLVDRLVQQARLGKFGGLHNGSPCSTWSRVRFVPGGPPPLRTRESPWGKPGNTQKEQEHTDQHSRLWRNSMKILEAVGTYGGPVSNEHPKDPGKHPYPSTWNLSEMKRIERKVGMERVIFPQCMWGLTSRKDTCISATLDGLQELDVLGNGRCCHKSHDFLMGLDEHGNFKTRRAQTYPPELCEKLAELYVRTWMRKTEIGQWVNKEEFGEEEEEKEDAEDPEYQLGERVPSPEVAEHWDKLQRWKEEARWVWKKEEHNNVLEARAGLISAKMSTMRKEQWGKKHLLISDSQVTIGVFGKGRSSKSVLNLLARRLAALAISTSSKFFWRYIRTHRNHADGPSRGEPLGVAKKDQEKDLQELKLPDFFYQKTRG